MWKTGQDARTRCKISESGADKSIATNNGNTPMSVAAERAFDNGRHAAVFLALLDAA